MGSRTTTDRDTARLLLICGAALCIVGLVLTIWMVAAPWSGPWGMMQGWEDDRSGPGPMMGPMMGLGSPSMATMMLVWVTPILLVGTFALLWFARVLSREVTVAPLGDRAVGWCALVVGVVLLPLTMMTVGASLLALIAAFILLTGQTGTVVVPEAQGK